jgi:tetratricopeptide (TPR) repeat protein
MKNILFFLSIFATFLLHSQQLSPIEKLLNWAELNIDKSPETVIRTLEYKIRKLDNRNTFEKALILDKLSFFYFFDLTSYELALKAAQRIELESRKSDDMRVKILYFENMGMLYYESKTNISKSFSYFKKAYSLSRNEKTNFHAGYILNNYAVSLMNEGNLDSSLKNLNLASYYCKKNFDYRQHSIIHSNIGICHLIQGKAQQTETSLKKSLYYAQLSKGKDDEAERCSFLARFYSDQGKTNEAMNKILVSLKNIHSIKRANSKLFVYKTYAEILEKTGQNEQTLVALNNYINYRDSIDFSKISKQLLAIESSLKIQELRFKNKLERTQSVNQRRTENLRYTVIILLLTLLLSIAFVILLKIRNRARISDLETQSMLLEKEKLSLELKSNEREVTLKSLHIFEKDNLISNIKQKLKHLSSQTEGEIKNEIQSTINELTYSLNNKSWDEFELRFNKINPDFYTNLERDFHRLSLNEKRLCAFLVMDMSTKEIADITGQSAHSINVARTRLRKKLEISNSDIQLGNFLSKYK